MTQSKSLFSIKLLSALIGVSSVLALPGLADASSVRLAQAEETEAEEQELSPEAMEILCKNFPLNSRCSGASQVEEGSPDAEGAADTPEAMESDDPSGSEMEAAPEESMEAPPEEGSDTMEVPEGGAEQPTMEAPPEEGSDTMEAPESPDTMEAPESSDTMEAPEGGAEQPAMEGEVSPEEGAPEAAPEGAITPSEAPAAPGVGQPEGMTPPEQPSF